MTFDLQQTQSATWTYFGTTTHQIWDLSKLPFNNNPYNLLAEFMLFVLCVFYSNEVIKIGYAMSFIKTLFNQY